MRGGTLRDTMRYGGVLAKVRALYGKRLTSADYGALLGYRSLREVAIFLEGHPGYRHLAKDLPANAKRDDFERVLREEVYLEYERIYKFMGREDHLLLELVPRRLELTLIFDFLRALNAGKPEQFSPRLSPFLKRRIPVDFGALAQAGSLAGGNAAFGKSIYRETLAAVPRRADGSANYLALEGALLAKYYEYALKTVETRYSGDEKTSMRKLLEREIELLNVMSLLRIKKYFPDMTEELLSSLIPVRTKMHLVLRNELLGAKDADAAIAYLVEESPFRSVFANRRYTNFEDYSKEYLFDENRKILRVGAPAPYVPLAYLALKESEIRNIIHLVERIRYNVTSEHDHFVPLGAETLRRQVEF